VKWGSHYLEKEGASRMRFRITVQRNNGSEENKTIAQCQNWDMSGPPVWDAPRETVPAELAELAWEHLGNLGEDTGSDSGSIPIVIGDATYRLAYSRLTGN